MTEKTCVELNVHDGHIATCACCENLNIYISCWDESEDDEISYVCKFHLLPDKYTHKETYDILLKGMTCGSIRLGEPNITRD